MCDITPLLIGMCGPRIGLHHVRPGHTDFCSRLASRPLLPGELAVPRFFSANCSPDHARLDELPSIKAGRLKDWHDNVEKTAKVP